MPKTKSSQRWLARQQRDPYVQQAKKDGYRSRAAYKLLEIQNKDRVIKQGMTVVDLGAAPGGWSQVAKPLVGKHGKIIALDILPMDSIPGVDFIQGDFSEESVFSELLARVEGSTVDVVICDIAPNLSGMAAVDQPRAMYLAELAFEFAKKVLPPGGAFIIKVFQGEGFDELLKLMRQNFEKVRSRKPNASRSKSKEMYMLATGFRAIVSP